MAELSGITEKVFYDLTTTICGSQISMFRIPLANMKPEIWLLLAGFNMKQPRAMCLVTIHDLS